MSTQIFLSSRAKHSKVKGPVDISLSSRAQRSAVEGPINISLSSRAERSAVEGPAVYNFHRQFSASNFAASPEHFGTASLLSALQERHPRATRFLALLFFLAGVALFFRIV